MPTRENIRNIDDRWQMPQPGWGRKDYEGRAQDALRCAGRRTRALSACGAAAGSAAELEAPMTASSWQPDAGCYC